MVESQGIVNVIDFLGDTLVWFAEHWDGEDGYLWRGWNTIRLSGLATLTAAVIAVPLGALLGHYRRFGVAAVASGVVIAQRRRRTWAEVEPEELRDRLHTRLAEAGS